jgi:hypothetical protein
MDVTATSAAGSAAGKAGTARISLADDFDSFLQLLTAQLKAQDPLAPMDANQFTQQLVQFSEVEQAIKANDALGQLVALIRGDQLSRRRGRRRGAEPAARQRAHGADQLSAGRCREPDPDRDLRRQRAPRRLTGGRHRRRQPQLELGRPRDERREPAGRPLQL